MGRTPTITAALLTDYKLILQSTVDKMQQNIVLGGCTDFIVEQVKKITSSSLQHILLANYLH
jgi:hypothetical protein